MTVVHVNIFILNSSSMPQYCNGKTRSYSKITNKHAAECSKAAHLAVDPFLRCKNCSYNDIVRSKSLLDKTAIFVCTGKLSYNEELLKSASS